MWGAHAGPMLFFLGYALLKCFRNSSKLAVASGRGKQNKLFSVCKNVNITLLRCHKPLKI